MRSFVEVFPNALILIWFPSRKSIAKFEMLSARCFGVAAATCLYLSTTMKS